MNEMNANEDAVTGQSTPHAKRKKVLVAVGATTVAAAMVLSGSMLAAGMASASPGNQTGYSVVSASTAHGKKHSAHQTKQEAAAQKADQKAAHQAAQAADQSHGLPSHNIQSEQEFAQKYMQKHFGWGPAQDAAVIAIFNRESGWNYHATNAGSGAYGIPQALPASKLASAGPNWRNNSHTQIKWGLNYIASRYGTPTAALAHEYSAGWY